ncbi:hypothetical protein LTR15_010890 [Elasticomyces elasticus]|nr:hypothetical protein LTR15_010890 [Elasticomyces elasticus]
MAADQQDDSVGLDTAKNLSVILRQLCEGQAALIHNISELVIAQKETTRSIDKLVQVQEAAIAPRSVLDAGSRLTNTFELLEQVLLHTDMETIFFAQHVNGAFKTTIKNSRQLQQKLYFIAGEAEGQPLLNPLLVKKSVMERLPLSFTSRSVAADAECQLVYSYGPGRRALTIQPPASTLDDTMNVSWPMRLYIDFDGKSTTEGAKSALGAGSWRRMYLTRQPCKIRCDISMWFLPVSSNWFRGAWKGFEVEGQQSMDRLLEELAACSLVERQ